MGQCRMLLGRARREEPPLDRTRSQVLHSGSGPSASGGLTAHCQWQLPFRASSRFRAANGGSCCRYMWLPVASGKRDRSSLLRALAPSLEFLSAHLGMGHGVLIHDDLGERVEGLLCQRRATSSTNLPSS